MGVLHYSANTSTLQRMPSGQELPSELYTLALRMQSNASTQG